MRGKKSGVENPIITIKLEINFSLFLRCWNVTINEEHSMFQSYVSFIMWKWHQLIITERRTATAPVLRLCSFPLLCFCHNLQPTLIGSKSWAHQQDVRLEISALLFQCKTPWLLSCCFHKLRPLWGLVTCPRSLIKQPHQTSSSQQKKWIQVTHDFVITLSSLPLIKKKNAGMWWQKARIIFLFSPYWSSGGYAQERWKHGGVFPALLGLHWCEEELWDFWLRDYIHCAAGLMTSHTQPYCWTVEHKLQREASGGDSEAGWNGKRRRWLWLFSAPSFFFNQ